MVLDTNVPLVANGGSPQAPLDCTEACVEALLRIREEKRLLLDEGGLILDEYRRNLSPSGQPGAGDAFFKWVWDNQANLEVCRQVGITPTADGSFLEFPADPALNAFDRSDRKFVAVALTADGGPPIWNAVDTDWWLFREPLENNGIRIEFLCPHLIGQ